jgi:DNA-binding transcriptional MerR regulator
VRVTSNSLRSGDLARLTGVSADTLRHYERLGIMPASPRTNGGYRLFPSSCVERVLLVQRSLGLGFSLKELANVLQTHDGGGIPCRHVLHLTEQKLLALERQIHELQQKQTYMRKLVREWRMQLKRTPAGRKARLLQSLIHKVPVNQRNSPKGTNANDPSCHPSVNRNRRFRTNP